MSAPQGLGAWIAFEHAIDPGPKTADLARAVTICKAIGAEWIVLRTGAGSVPDADLSEASIFAFAAAGIRVFLWPFIYAGALEGELKILRRYRGLCVPGGRPIVQGIVLNAEYQFMAGATVAEATTTVRRVREIGYEWVAHAPPDHAGGRGEGPLKTLDALCDAILPQTYAWEHNDLGHVHTIDKVLALYGARGLGLDKVWPILCTYRPRFRGKTPAPANVPIPTPPLANEAARVAGDIVAGLDRIDALGGCPAPSLYSIDGMQFASRPGVAEAVLAALTVRQLRGRAPPAVVFDLTTPKGIQGALVALGYNPGPIDGVVGALTLKAIRLFQANHSLVADGIVGPKTHAALAAALGQTA